MTMTKVRPSAMMAAWPRLSSDSVTLLRTAARS